MFKAHFRQHFFLTAANIINSWWSITMQSVFLKEKKTFAPFRSLQYLRFLLATTSIRTGQAFLFFALLS